MALRLPAPSLVVLVGPSGSGKTTWADEHFEANEVVSSDRLRAMVGAGEDDQAAGTAAFSLLDDIVTERMRRRLTTVIDTLGMDPDARQRWVALARESDVPSYAVLFETPPEVCEQRNAERARPVPKTVLRKQISRFGTAREAIEAEGFTEVISEQPVATVAPVVATAADAVAVSDAASEAGGGHTFGLMVSRFDWDGDIASTLADVARRAETAGFRDIWVMDHFRQIRAVGRPWEDIPEAYAALGHIASATSTIRMGTLVTGITHRNPVILGKTIATLDVLSGGRMICGLGIG